MRTGFFIKFCIIVTDFLPIKKIIIIMKTEIFDGSYHQQENLAVMKRKHLINVKNYPCLVFWGPFTINKCKCVTNAYKYHY